MSTSLGEVARFDGDGRADAPELPEGVVLVAHLALGRPPRNLDRERR